MTLNFEEIELGYKSLAEFYLTLSYHTDDLPVDQLLNLPALSEIPKLPKVNCHLKTRVRFELSILNRWTVIGYFTTFDEWYWFSWIFPTVFTSKYVSNWMRSNPILTFKLSENYVVKLSNFQILNCIIGCQLEIAYSNINRFMLRASAENERTMSGLHSLVLEKLA